MTRETRFARIQIEEGAAKQDRGTGGGGPCRPHQEILTACVRGSLGPFNVWAILANGGVQQVAVTACH